MKTLLNSFTKALFAVSILFIGIAVIAQQNSYINQLDKSPQFNTSKSGDLLFDQISTPGDGWIWSDKFTNISSNTMTCAAADDFDVPTGETWDVFSIEILGSYESGGAGGGNTVNVHFMADDDGQPGDTLHEYLAYTNLIIQEELVGDQIATYFEIILPSTISFPEGTYWFSVQLVTDQDVTGGWGWREHMYTSTVTGAEWHWCNPKDGMGTGWTEYTPANLVVGPWLMWELSFALYGQPLENDIAVLDPIISPEDFYYGPPPADVPVTVNIKNEGSNPQTGFDMKYIFEGTEVIENIGALTIEPNEIVEFSFSQMLDLSAPGEYDLIVASMLPGDEHPENDSQSLTTLVFDPTVYTMPSMSVGSVTTCSGTFADAGGLEGALVADDWGIYTIHPENPGSKIRLEFSQFDISWGEFRIYDGIDTNANVLGFWEDDLSPGTITATVPNTSGALTISYFAQTWTPLEAPGWAANIVCFEPVEDDFAVLNVELDYPDVYEHDYVTVFATIQNTGTLSQSKELTYTANGEVFATVTSPVLTPSEIVTVEAVWNPLIADDFELLVSIPEDQGEDENNEFSINQVVFPFNFFWESFEFETFPPDGWTQSGNSWDRNIWGYQPCDDAQAYLWIDYGLIDTLISPKLSISEGDVIKFSAYSSPWWPGEMDLCWKNSETGEWNLIEAVNLPWGAYQEIEIDISVAAGINYLGFAGKYNPTGGSGEVHMDCIEGIGIERQYYENDLKAYVLDGNNTPEEDVLTSFDVEVKNVGSLPQLGSDYNLVLKTETGVELASYPGNDIDIKQVLNFTLDYTFEYAGLFKCYVEVELDEDEYQLDNSSTSLDVYVQQTGTIQIAIGDGEDYESNWWHPITTYSSAYYTQTLFLEEDLGEPSTITGIMYYYVFDENYPVSDIPVMMWMSETEETNMSDSLEAANNYQLVFEGSVDFQPGYHGVYIPLDFVYSYQGGNLMITTFKENDTPFLGTSHIKTTHTDEVMVRYYNGYNEAVDPYSQQSLDTIFESSVKYKTEFANIKFFKFDLGGQYCTPQTINGTALGDYIDGVSFNDIENIATGSLGGQAYTAYSELSTNVERGRAYELTIQAETSGEEGSIAAWIDYNGNKELDEEGERIVHITSDESSQEITVLVEIPDDAAIGLTVLRVRNSADAELFASCEAVEYGETEDYPININETIQVYNPVSDFSATLLEEGNVDLNWEVPENPGIAHTEGFEMSIWPPQSGWQVKQSTSLTDPLVDPTGDTWMQYNEDMQYVYNGAYAALSPASAMDFNWLITPQVQLYGNDEISFMLNYTADAGGYSKFYVLIESDEEWTTILEYVDETTMYNNYDEFVTVGLEEFAGKVVRIAFVTEYNDAYPIAIDDAILKGVAASEKTVSGIVGYDIYRNGELFANIEDASINELTDELTATENYIYCISVLYDDNEKSEELCDNVFYLAPLTAPLNVIASTDDNDVTILWTAPNGGMTRFTDGFEDYSAGQQVACQNPDDWTTWTLTPCSSSDPYVTTEMPYDGDNSVVIEYEADLLYVMDEMLTEGKYSYNFRMYVPEGYNGYFNVLQDHELTTQALWGMQVFFDLNGIGTIDGGAYGAATFLYEYNEWMYIETVVDLDNDWAEFKIDGELIHEWQWSLGISGVGGILALEGGDFFAWNNNNTCRYFFDDFQIIQLYDNLNLVDYNIYKDGSLLGNTTETEYADADVDPGYHNYCVSAIYDEGESDQSCDYITIFTAPQNFTAEVQNENDVFCQWDEIVGDGVLGYHVYRDNELVSGLVTELEWTDEGVEGGTHTYYAITVFDNGESLPSDIATVIIIITPTNLVANADDQGNIILNWDAVGEVQSGEMVELYQHDETPTNGVFQWFNFGYGVVFNLAAYPGATIEMIDFHHASWEISGIWSYTIHIVDWTTYTEIGIAGPFQTTGDDIWELEIPMGSIPSTSNQIGIFLEPMSNDPENAYPVLSSDASLEGTSFEVDLFDYETNIPAVGDYLIDLWIWAPTTNKMVKPEKVKLNNMNSNARKPYMPVNSLVTVNQKEKDSKALTGYKVFYAHESDPFEFIDTSIDTTYAHEGSGYIQGLHKYYVTATYEEGESEPSNEAQEYITGISENELDNIFIYPNPVIDLINIETNLEILSLQLTNSKGQLILNEEGIKTVNYQVNVADQPAGIFNLRIETEDGWTNKKIIKIQ